MEYEKPGPVLSSWRWRRIGGVAIHLVLERMVHGHAYHLEYVRYKIGTRFLSTKIQRAFQLFPVRPRTGGRRIGKGTGEDCRWSENGSRKVGNSPENMGNGLFPAAVRRRSQSSFFFRAGFERQIDVKMEYVTSVQRTGRREGRQEGVSDLFGRQLSKKFHPHHPSSYMIAFTR